jgi:peptidoglycan hydrolase-like protein with peptidoglycan-binding domain
VFGVRGSGQQAPDQERDRPESAPEQAGPAHGTPESGGPAHGGPAHGGPEHGGSGHRQRSRVIALGTVALAVIAVAAAYALMHSGSARPGGHKPGRGSGTVAALKILSVTPAAGARQVDGSAPVLVQFSAPLAAGSPEPVIRPVVAGTWSHVGDDASFTPARPFRPGSRFTVEIPGGAGGVRTAAGAVLARPMTARFATRGYSQLRLGELLSQLGYLPLTWSPQQGGAIRSEEEDAGDVARSQASLAYDPPAGSFRWQPGYPSVLASMWEPGHANVVLRGAVMAFQSEHGMTIDGTVGPRLWSALFRAAQKGHRNGNGYTYAVASKSLPESLTIWHDGRVVMRTLANTGIPVSPTVDGTFPVYQRFRFQIMRGTNPDGSSYADPVSYVSYFNGGDAVHYFPRGSYGFQQSLGCVELPFGSAEQAYPYLTYGSLVTVAG